MDDDRMEKKKTTIYDMYSKMLINKVMVDDEKKHVLFVTSIFFFSLIFGKKIFASFNR